MPDLIGPRLPVSFPGGAGLFVRPALRGVADVWD